MKKYSVRLTTTAIMSTEVLVEANSWGEAADLAVDKVTSERYIDWKYEGIPDDATIDAVEVIEA